MSQQAHRLFAATLMVMGVMLALMSFAGGWNTTAYGATGGPTPTPGEGKLHIKKVACHFDATPSANGRDLDCKSPGDPNNPNDRFDMVPGGRFTYRIFLSNTGVAPVTQLMATDMVPARLTILGATTSQGTLVQRGQLVSVTIARLASGGVATVTIHVRINQPAGPVNQTHEEQITNTAYARADGISTQSSSITVGAFVQKTAGVATAPAAVAPAAPLVQQPLLASGAMLFLSGAFLFRRQRKLR